MSGQALRPADLDIATSKIMEEGREESEAHLRHLRRLLNGADEILNEFGSPFHIDTYSIVEHAIRLHALRRESIALVRVQEQARRAEAQEMDHECPR